MGRVGTDPARVDGRSKVSGEARYIDDLQMPGMLFGATKRSPHAHARIVSIEFDAERAPSDSTCVLAKDIPGHNGIQILDDSWPVLAEDVVNHVGEAVALVSGPSREAALVALDCVIVEYEPLPAILSWDEADSTEALDTISLHKGDVTSALEESHTVLEATYFTGHQEHLYIECQGVIADWQDNEHVVLRGSMQCPYYVNKAMAHALALEPDNVRVVAELMGGAFGGKEDYPSLLAVHAALLSRAANRPVKMVYERNEDIIATTKRHPSRTTVRSGVNSNGELQALDIEFDLDGGAYLTLSPVVLSRGILHATGPYRCPNVSIRGRVLRTNTAPNGAFRGFGAPQSQFAIERQMDRIGRALGIDPLTLRQRNVLRAGDELATGQVLDASAAGPLVLERVADRANFAKRWREAEARKQVDDGSPLVGLGLSLYFHGAGFTGLGETRMRSPVTLRLGDDGCLEILCASTEMGQGAFTVLAMIAAEAAGIEIADVRVVTPDTSIVPDSGPTVASRTSMIVGGVVARAAKELVAKLDAPDHGSFRERAQHHIGKHGALEVTLRNEPPAWQQFDEETYKGVAYPTYAWGADVIEVEVDPDTFEVRATHATVANEVGKVLHANLCKGQVEGGTLQAIGYALHEDMQMHEGHPQNDRLATYIIPTIMDGPDMDTQLLEQPWSGEPSGAKGVGELPMAGGAPAVCAAIENAIGIVPTQIPATPERLFNWNRIGQRVEALQPDKGAQS